MLKNMFVNVQKKSVSKSRGQAVFSRRAALAGTSEKITTYKNCAYFVKWKRCFFQNRVKLLCFTLHLPACDSFAPWHGYGEHHEHEGRACERDLVQEKIFFNVLLSSTTKTFCRVQLLWCTLHSSFLGPKHGVGMMPTFTTLFRNSF